MMRELPSPVTPDWPLYAAEDDEAAEYEVGAVLQALIIATKPRDVVEVGTHRGATAERIGQALLANGVGQLTTYEIDVEKAKAARKRLAHLPVRVVAGDASGREFGHPGLDMLFVDGCGETKELDVLHWADRLRPEGYLFVHDALKDHNTYLAVRRIPWPTLWVRTPRGLAVLQRPSEEEDGP